jgi:hypothetical protein
MATAIVFSIKGQFVVLIVLSHPIPNMKRGENIVSTSQWLMGEKVESDFGVIVIN